MTKNCGAFFFDSHQLGSDGDSYLLAAEKLHNDLLKTEKYQNMFQNIEVTLDSKNKNKKVPLIENNIQTQSQISNFLQKFKDLKSKTPKIRNTIQKKKNKSSFPKLKRISKLVTDKANENLSKILKAKKEQKKEILGQVNDQRFKTQNKFLEKYLEMKQEISEHFERIIALKKVINKIENQ